MCIRDSATTVPIALRYCLKASVVLSVMPLGVNNDLYLGTFGPGICDKAFIPLIHPFLIKYPVKVPARIFAIVLATETLRVFSSTLLFIFHIFVEILI